MNTTKVMPVPFGHFALCQIDATNQSPVQRILEIYSMGSGLSQADCRSITASANLSSALLRHYGNWRSLVGCEPRRHVNASSEKSLRFEEDGVSSFASQPCAAADYCRRRPKGELVPGRVERNGLESDLSRPTRLAGGLVLL